MPAWREIRKLPLRGAGSRAAQSRDSAQAGRKPRTSVRAGERAVGAEARGANFKWIFPLDKPTPPYRSIAEIAAESNKDPVEVMIDLALEKHLKQFFLQTLVNENQDHVLEMMRHPRSVVTFSDSGAHVSQIMDSSLQTHVLSHWVREKQAFTLEEAIRMLSFVPASQWGLNGRGLLREGYRGRRHRFRSRKRSRRCCRSSTYDLPAGARRLKQKADRSECDGRQRPGAPAQQ